LLALFLLPFVIAYNSVKGAFIVTAQGLFVSALLWIFLSPLMIVLSVIVGIGITKDQFIEYKKTDE